MQLQLRLQRHTNAVTVTIINKEIRSQNIGSSAQVTYGAIFH